MGVDEGNLQFIHDVEVMMEKCPIISIPLRYIITHVAIMVFVIHTTSYICDSRSKR